MSETQKDSAPTVSLKFLLDLSDAQEPTVTNTKCTSCNTSGPHQWFKVGPMPLGPVEDAMAIIAMYKRVTMCQNCGTVKVTK